MLDKSLYEKQISGAEQISQEDSVFYLTEKIVVEDGVKQYLKGGAYPLKGLASPEALFAISGAKRLIIEGTKLGLKMPFIASLILIGIFPHKWRINAIQGILGAYKSITERSMETVLLKPENLNPMARELLLLTKDILTGYGISEDLALYTAKCFAHLIEYDNAYRYRLQDLFTASSKEAFVNTPYKELNRLAKVMWQRQGHDLANKFTRLMKILSLGLFLPRFRKSFRQAFENCSFEKLQFDEGDIYWVSMRTDYDYLGEDVETRSKRNKGKTMPIPMHRDEYLRQMKEKEKQDLDEKGKTKCVMIPVEHWEKMKVFLETNKFSL
jgi:hypothetical protein